ncbi:MAG: glycolate oxidase subunit GlcF [Caulobacteraceae bacterium]
MRTALASPLAETAAGAIAEEVLRACVHCGMCNATCPTFLITGDELDGPRGRIYLIKQALEGESVGALTRTHLDRCLSCRACETTCPSGVEYHRLFDIGREAVAAKAPRPAVGRLQRWFLRTAFASPRAARSFFALGRALRPFLPPFLSRKIPRLAPVLELPTRARERRMELLAGCVQSAAAPHFNLAATRVFERVGVSLEETPGVGCCGALAFHLDAREEGRSLAKANIARWLAALDDGSQAIVVASSGCAAFIRDYPDILAGDRVWAEKARRVAESVKDPIEILGNANLAATRAPADRRVAVHEPCTLQHGPRLSGRIPALLASLGYEPQRVADAHLCCGSAGAYSLTQPAFAKRLRADKLAALTAADPAAIYTANIGCWLHLAESSPVPVRHWLEAVDEMTSRPA